MPATQLLRALPSIDALLRTPEARALVERTGTQRLTALARSVTDELRAELQARANAPAANVADDDTNKDADPNGDAADADRDFTRESLLAEAVERLGRAVALADANNLRRVVNATGVILHTNLGRAPLSEAARRAVSVEAAGYCTLEYDLATGARGRRGARAEELLAELTGAEAALVVNNCAAAALLILSTLAAGGESIVSRGELVEIGGDFRVPDVMAASGTSMREVGTTNRTNLADYERAITPETRLIVRVHPSNYRVVGFTAAPSLAALAALAHEHNLPLYEDAGSGALLDLSAYNLQDEPVIRESVAGGADIVSFSGDKLLGATQAGLIVGRRALVERCRRNPLYRALRADKLALAALAATLEAHARGATFAEVPAMRMLAATREEIETRARAFMHRAQSRSGICGLRFEIINGESAIGGGSAPLTHPPTALIALKHAQLSADALEARLREANPPVIARILDERLVLDLRTVAEEEESELLNALVGL
ncbi:MAG TPA: L-seryl-tRNA(Sec) selenium transferase [Pyrinomonadaceae bacterium]|nr:L-seryl-tRNA(Sec) selenium transferase [Pyrinomonadaceae bacterium]